MPVMLAGKPGFIVAMTDPVMAAVTPIVSLPDAPINFQNQKSLITRIVLSEETNHQFLHTLGNDIYIYVFGDRVGQMTISGLSGAKDCANSGDNEHGFEQIRTWYGTNKLSNNPNPVNILLGSKTRVSGYVAGSSVAVFDHRLMLMQFDISLMIIPEKT